MEEPQVSDDGFVDVSHLATPSSDDGFSSVDEPQGPPPPLDLKIRQKRGEVSKGESFARGMGQGATFGFQDELSPSVERALGSGEQALGYGLQAIGADKMGRRMIESGQPSADLDYKIARDEYRADNKLAKEAHPGYSAAGNVVGGLPAAIATGNAMSPAVSGGVFGALQGAGESTTETPL